MKQNIRHNTFETNSSSIHSLILVNVDQFEKFKNKELYFLIAQDKFITKNEISELADFKSENPNFNNLNSDEKIRAVQEFIEDFSDCDYPILATYHSLDLCTQEVYDKDGNKQIAFSYYING